MLASQNLTNSRRDEYLTKAAESRQYAVCASNLQERARWEHIAHLWEYIALQAYSEPRRRR